jgi:hypothetical protein
LRKKNQSSAAPASLAWPSIRLTNAPAYSVSTSVAPRTARITDCPGATRVLSSSCSP